MKERRRIGKASGRRRGGFIGPRRVSVFGSFYEFDFKSTTELRAPKETASHGDACYGRGAPCYFWRSSHELGSSIPHPKSDFGGKRTRNG